MSRQVSVQDSCSHYQADYSASMSKSVGKGYSKLKLFLSIFHIAKQFPVLNRDHDGQCCTQDGPRISMRFAYFHHQF